MSNNDLEQFDSEALNFFIEFLNEGIRNRVSLNTNTLSDSELENLQALRIMLYNAKAKVKEREKVNSN